MLLPAARLITLFLLYFTFARLGLTLDAVAGFASLVWPAAGIALASLFLGGLRLWPAVLVAAFLVNYLNGAPIVIALAIGLGNTFEALFGAFILNKILNFSPSMERLQDALAIINISILAPVISAVIGTSSLFAAGIIPGKMYQTAWLTWWVGDLLGILLVSPLIFAWSRVERPGRKTNFKYLLDVGISFIVLIIFCLMIFTGLFGINAGNIPITQTLYPILIWFSIRFSPRISFSAVFLVALLAVLGTAEGHGPFVRGRLSESLLDLQAFLATIGLTFIVLTAAMSERRKLQNLKDEFISAASHELRTPITTIKAYAQLLYARLSKSKSASLKGLKLYIVRMEEQVNRLTGLVTELLDVSRIESGKMKLRFEKFKVEELLEEIAQDFKRTTPSHRIITKSPTGLIVSADRFRIAQVLINLISNAIKFSPKADKVLVTAKEETGFLTVSVKDSGIGIDPKYQSEIFSRFFQAGQSTMADSSGLGLGLYIASGIIKQHGGKMWVASKKGRGSTFFFKLPLAEHYV